MRNCPKTTCHFRIAISVLSSLLVVAVLLAAAFGQANNSHQTMAGQFKRPVYVPLDRSEEDWSILKDPTLRSDPWDPLKYIPLRHDSNWYLTLAGEERRLRRSESTPTV